MNLINRIYNWLKERLTLEEFYVFEGSEIEMETRLYRTDYRPDYHFNIKPGKRKTHVITPLVSVGIGMVNGGGGKHITVCLEKVNVTENTVEIRLYTTIRPENWVMMVLFPVVLAITSASGLPFVHVFFLALLLIIAFGWFNFVYRNQEEALIEKIKRRLRLGEQIFKTPSLR